MYFNKTVLTLMAISLYLIPRAELAVQSEGETSEEEQLSDDTTSLDQGQLVNEVIKLQNAEEFKDIINNNEKIEQLCVVYYVDKTDIYDEMFRELATQHLATKFVKADVSILNGRETTEEKKIKLEILFYKFGAYAGHITSDDKTIIEDQIKLLEKMPRGRSDNNSTDYNDEEQEIQIEHSDGIYRTDNKPGLDFLYNEALADGQFIFAYLVINTDKYDQMFKELAEKHIKTRFIKIDATTFKYIDGIFNSDVEPVMVFQRLDAVTSSFVTDKKDEIDARLDYFENMTQDDFEIYVNMQQKERQQEKHHDDEGDENNIEIEEEGHPVDEDSDYDSAQEKRQEAEGKGKQVEIEKEDHPVDEDSDDDSEDDKNDY